MIQANLNKCQQTFYIFIGSPHVMRGHLVKLNQMNIAIEQYDVHAKLQSRQFKIDLLLTIKLLNLYSIDTRYNNIFQKHLNYFLMPQKNLSGNLLLTVKTHQRKKNSSTRFWK